GEASLASQGKRVFIKWLDETPKDIAKPNLDLYDAATGKLIKSYSIGYGDTYVSRRRNFAVVPAVADEDDDKKRSMQLLDATTGEKIHEVTVWHPALRVRDVSED